MRSRFQHPLLAALLFLSAFTLSFLGARADSRCSFDSDCGPGVSCRSGKCATAYNSSCAFDSDCGGASCRSGKCANAPDGTCAFDSDCGKGVSCRSGRCASR